MPLKSESLLQWDMLRGYKDEGGGKTTIAKELQRKFGRNTMIALPELDEDKNVFSHTWRVQMLKRLLKLPNYDRSLKDRIPYDPEKQYAVMRVSICTGEKVAGFKNYDDGHFTEVMLIRHEEDEKRFKAIYGLDKIKTEY